MGACDDLLSAGRPGCLPASPGLSRPCPASPSLAPPCPDSLRTYRIPCLALPLFASLRHPTTVCPCLALLHSALPRLVLPCPASPSRACFGSVGLGFVGMAWPRHGYRTVGPSHLVPYRLGPPCPAVHRLTSLCPAAPSRARLAMARLHYVRRLGYRRLGDVGSPRLAMPTVPYGSPASPRLAPPRPRKLG